MKKCQKYWHSVIIPNITTSPSPPPPLLKKKKKGISLSFLYQIVSSDTLQRLAEVVGNAARSCLPAIQQMNPMQYASLMSHSPAFSGPSFLVLLVLVVRTYVITPAVFSIFCPEAKGCRSLSVTHRRRHPAQTPVMYSLLPRWCLPPDAGRRRHHHPCSVVFFAFLDASSASFLE